MKSKFKILIILFLAIRVFAMFYLPIMEPTEGRYALVAAEIVRTNDWTTPHLWYRGKYLPFLGKPPLHFWMAAASIKLFGFNPFATRLPALLVTVLLLLYTSKIMEKYDKLTIRKALIMVTSSALLFALSGASATDMTVSVFTVLAILSYARFVQKSNGEECRFWSLHVFLFLALGFMTKGPVAVILFGLPVFFWTLVNNKWAVLKKHSWFLGIGLFILLTLPWFIACEKANPGFCKYFFVNENFLRFITPEYGDRYGSGHIFPRGSAILMFIGSAFPWTLMWKWESIKKGVTSNIIWQKLKHEDSLQGLLLWGAITNVLFWCLARQLLSTYLLPAAICYCIFISFSEKLSFFNYKFVLRTATVLLIFYTVTIIGLKFKRHDSFATEVMQTINSMDESHRKKQVVFVRKTPYSAFFYGTNKVVPHPKEPIDQSLQRTGTVPVMYAFEPKYFRKLNKEQLDRLNVLAKSRNMVLAERKVNL